MFKCIASAAVVAGMAAVAPPASAQACGDRDELIAELDSLHKEHLVAAGLHDEHHLVELWASEDGATWTLLLSRADGFACVMGAGSAWLPYPEGDVVAGIEG
jgi:hypothetical protein